MAEENKIFADSNFFIALYNPSDSLHSESVRISQKIKKEDPDIYISNYIFLEIVTVISQRIGRKEAVFLGNEILKNPKINIIHVDETLNKLAWQIFTKVPKKNFSFVDCSTLALLQFEEIGGLLTFDRKDFISFKDEYRFKLYS